MKEQWLPVPGYPQYLISDKGNVFSKKSNRELNPWIDSTTGYYRFYVQNRKSDKKVKPYVHRLVASLFIENPNGYTYVNHLDGNKLNNSADNLEWCSQKRNVQHAFKMGLVNHTTGVQQLREDGSFIRTYQSIHEAGRDLGISAMNIHSVCKGRRQRAGGYRWAYCLHPILLDSNKSKAGAVV